MVDDYDDNNMMKRGSHVKSRGQTLCAVNNANYCHNSATIVSTSTSFHWLVRSFVRCIEEGLVRINST